VAKKKEDPLQPIVRVASLGVLKAYTIQEHELDALARGSPGSVLFSFALAMLPLSGSFLITLLTTSIATTGGQIFFVCSCLITFLFGLLCLVLWWKTNVGIENLVQEIKNRMPAAAVQETVGITESEGEASRKPPPNP
jgi:hypothetical protein